MFLTKQQIIDLWLPRLAAGREADYALAMEISNSALFDETTRDGGSYIEHPVEVSQGTMSTKKKIVALLHDVVEDSDWTLDDLRTVGFSEEIVLAVDAVTKRDGEKYFDFIVRGGLVGELAIDVKLSDLTHNLNKTRSENINPSDKHVWKEKAYNISYYYLVAIKKGNIEPGTPILDFIKTRPNYVSEPAIVNELMDRFSEDNGRLLTPTLSSRFPSVSYRDLDM